LHEEMRPARRLDDAQLVGARESRSSAHGALDGIDEGYEPESPRATCAGFANGCRMRSDGG